ncbi:rhombosortase [Alteromonas sp. 5E99-2]|uniref:rhombosortase n=1 Tax=Alteromonas sp. 5E99-2 TaxID=2817683 RepID=UPI001A98AA42|nr:rhombosortase [Alteromonas sp. 5E99-2]MBO1254855.1 rhombosortase [Alteromonas sp. 5E99-2]
MKLIRLPTEKEHLLPILILASLSVGSYVVTTFFYAPFIQLFEYDKHALLNGEIWRSVTGHLFHSNFNHLVLNIGGLFLLWGLHGEKYKNSRLLFLFLFISVFISTCMLFFTTDITRYVGLSGVLHGMFVWGACDDIRKGYKTGYLMIIGSLIKVASEQWNGPDPELGKTINATVAIDAHLYGVLAGIIVYFVLCFAHKFSSKSA